MLYGADIFNDLCLVQFNQYKLTSVVFLEVDSLLSYLDWALRDPPCTALNLEPESTGVGMYIESIGPWSTYVVFEPRFMCESCVYREWPAVGWTWDLEQASSQHGVAWSLVSLKAHLTLG